MKMIKNPVLFLLLASSLFLFNGCGGSDDPVGEPPSFSEQMIYLLNSLKNSTVQYNDLEESSVKPYLEKAIIDMDEAIGLMRNYKEDEDLPDEFLLEISAVVDRAVVSVKEASLRSKVTDNRYDLLEKALKHVAERLSIV